jgi:hypothetical protein
MTNDIRNPEPSRPTVGSVMVIIGVLVGLYVLVHWPQLSGIGPIHDLLVALRLQE